MFAVGILSLDSVNDVLNQSRKKWSIKYFTFNFCISNEKQFAIWIFPQLKTPKRRMFVRWTCPKQSLECHSCQSQSSNEKEKKLDKCTCGSNKVVFPWACLLPWEKKGLSGIKLCKKMLIISRVWRQKIQQKCIFSPLEKIIVLQITWPPSVWQKTILFNFLAPFP